MFSISTIKNNNNINNNNNTIQYNTIHIYSNNIYNHYFEKEGLQLASLRIGITACS